MEEIRLKDCDTRQEYYRLRMNAINRRKRHEVRLSRFALTLSKIREYESKGMTDDEIVKQLASHYEYKLVNDKDMGNKAS